jgi:hypothetical protein
MNILRKKERSLKGPGWEKVIQMDLTEIGYDGVK